MKQLSQPLPLNRWTPKRKVLSVVFCLVLIVFVAVGRELFTPEFFECHHEVQPFASQSSANQAVFIARVIATGTLWPITLVPSGEGNPSRYWGLAVVQKSYWGLPWWDRKIVLLTSFRGRSIRPEGGETYFVDGWRWTRPLTRLLPIFEVQCTRTGPLRYADIDLRAMRDGAPKNGVRILGYTARRTSNSTWETVPGQMVGISGPSGETPAISDEQGIYDVSGLPPGSYIVHGTNPGELPECIWEGRQSLASGDIRECGIDVR